MPISLLHLSDLHIARHGPHGKSALKDTCSPAEGLQAAITYALSMRVHWTAALLSGDLVDRGSAEEYRLLRHALAPLEQRMPLYFCLGNHDSRLGFRTVFSDFWNAHIVDGSSFLQYQVPLGQGQRLVVLDTLWEGSDVGRLCSQRLDWLESTLRTVRDEQVILALHHPPFVFGNTIFDAMAVRERAELATVLARNPQVKRVVCGHLHRTMLASLADRPVFSAPSTFHAYGMDHAEDNHSGVTNEAPGFAFHQWQKDCGWLSHTVCLRQVRSVS